MENIIKKLDEIDKALAEAQEIISSMRYEQEELDYSTKGNYEVTFANRHTDKKTTISKTVFAESICDAIAKASVTADAPFPSVISDREYMVTEVKLLDSNGLFVGGTKKFIRVGDELKNLGQIRGRFTKEENTIKWYPEENKW